MLNQSSMEQNLGGKKFLGGTKIVLVAADSVGYVAIEGRLQNILDLNDTLYKSLRGLKERNYYMILK